MINLINELQNLIKTLKTTVTNLEKKPSSAKERRHKSTSWLKEKEKNQEQTQNSYLETKNKFKNKEQMENEMDATTTIQNMKIEENIQNLKKKQKKHGTQNNRGK